MSKLIEAAAEFLSRDTSTKRINEASTRENDSVSMHFHKNYFPSYDHIANTSGGKASGHHAYNIGRASRNEFKYAIHHDGKDHTFSLPEKNTTSKEVKKHIPAEAHDLAKHIVRFHNEALWAHNMRKASEASKSKES